MPSPNPTLKNCAKVALGALTVLVIGAFIFYKERILFADSAFKTFNIIRKDAFDIDLMRYGSFVSQLLPWLGQKLHLPIKVILVGYSVSFNLFYLLAAALLYRSRQYRLVVLMACYFFLIVSDSYYWPNDELHQAVGWMFILFGTTLYLGERNTSLWVLLPVFTVIAFLSIFTHFVVILPLAFLWIYLWIEHDHWTLSRPVSILLTSVLVALISLKYVLTTGQSYDGPHLRNATHFTLRDIRWSFATPIVRMFFERCRTNYWLAVVLMVIGLVSLARKQKLLVAYTVAACLGYIALIGLTYSSRPDEPNNIYLFHIETEWAAIGIFMAAPFVFSLLGKLRPSYGMAVLTLVFLIRLAYIGNAAPRFTQRTNERQKLMTQMRMAGITKVGIHHDEAVSKKYILDWALPYECMLNSLLDGDTTSRTAFFFHSDDKLVATVTSDPKAFYNCWDVMAWTNKDRYFRLNTTNPYRKMTYEELMKK